jgi:D-alanyl-D-alanine carboxypeptidase
MAEAKYAAIALDAESGLVLHETNADTKNFPASLTKMMTLYLLFEALQQGEVTLKTKMKVSAYAAKQQPSKLGLKTGSTITVESAIRALVTKSANDVAVVVAEHLGKTESGFAKLMTEKARKLGMSRTTFKNASGLPNSKQVSTARDIATLALALMDNYPQYYHYFATRTFTYKGKTYENHNALLKRADGVDGLKTGYTKASGFNIAVTAVRDGRRVIVVVFGGKTAKARDNQADALLNGAYAAIAKLDLPAPKPRDVVVAKAPAKPAVLPPEKPLAAVVLPRDTVAEGSALVAATPLPSPSLPAPTPQGALQSGTQGGTQVAALGSVGSDALPGGWSVQVGAFSRYNAAESAAVDAAGQAAQPLAGAQIYVMEVQGQSGKLYRARLTGLAEPDAREACRLLTKQNQACLVVAPGS